MSRYLSQTCCERVIQPTPIFRPDLRVRAIVIIALLSAAVALLPLAACAVTLGVNLLANGGFESGLTEWAEVDSPAWQVVNGISHTGTSSMQVQNDDPTYYKYPHATIPVEPGIKYVFSAWLRCENVAGPGGVLFAIQWYDSSGRWLGISSFTPVARGTFDWIRIVHETDAMPANAAKAGIFLLMSKGVTGKAWFDDIIVKAEDGLVFSPFIKYPTYRNTIYPGQPERVVVSVKIRDTPRTPLNTMSLRVRVIDAESRVMGDAQISSLVKKDWDNVALNLTKLPPGIYKVAVELRNAVSGMVIAGRDLSITVLDPAQTRPKVYLDEQQRCIVDGKPFFPIGVYTWLYSSQMSTATAVLDRLANSKINCIFNYGCRNENIDLFSTILREAGKRGLKVVAVVDNGFVAPWDPTPTPRESFEATKQIVAKYRGEPDLLAWYINDEKSGWCYNSDLVARYNYVSGTDPDHPVVQMFAQAQLVEPSADNTDIVGRDCYPVRNGYVRGATAPNLQEMGTSVELAQYSLLQTKPVWAAAECSSMKALTASSMPPTLPQIMCISYQALAAGARGLTFFCLDWLLKDDGELQWTTLKRAADELHRVEPIVLGDDSPLRNCVTVSDARVMLLTRQVGSETYVLAVNPYSDTVSAVFTIGTGWPTKIVEIAMPDEVSTRSIIVAGNIFSDTIEASGTRVYRLMK